MHSKRNYLTVIVLSLNALLSLYIHLIPFYLYSSHPLGYDTGFYRRYIIQPFVSFPNPGVPGLGSDAIVPRILLDILRLTPLSTDHILYGSYICFFLLTPIFLYFLVAKTYNKRIGLIASFLLVTSSIQYMGYWYMLWKNMWALCLLLLALYYLEKKSLAPVILLDIAIALSHKTTAIMYIITLAFMLIMNRSQWKTLLVHIAITATSLILINPHTYQTIIATPVAIFTDWNEYLWLSLPLLIFTLFGLKKFLHKKHSSIIAFALASFIFPVFRLPFYERIFVFTDIAIVIVAACGIEFLYSFAVTQYLKKRSFALIASLVLLIGTGTTLGNLSKEIRTLQPLISAENLIYIETFSKELPRDATILTTSDEAPWFEGWSLAHVAAPGMLQDTHNLDQWTKLWDSTSTEAHVAFLGTFPQPLYVVTFSDIHDLIGNPPPCLKEYSRTVSYNTCNKK